MELKLLSVALLLIVSFAMAQAIVPPEEYWKSVLPGTRMAKAIKDILYQTHVTSEDGAVDSAGSGAAPDVANGPGGTSVGVGKGGVSVFKGKPVYVGVQPGPSQFKYGYAVPETQTHDNPNTGPSPFQYGYSATETQLRDNPNTGPSPFQYGYAATKTQLRDNPNTGPSPFQYGYAATETQLHDKPNMGPSPFLYGYAATETQTHDNPNTGPSPFQYGYAATETQLHDKPNTGSSPFLYGYAATETQTHDKPNMTIFFLEKDLKQGKTMSLHFTKSSNEAAFLPREVADTTPFSSNSLLEIYSTYSVKPNSVEAETMKNTIKGCEDPGIEGEEKYCATSLESMIDFSKSKLGKDIKSVSTEVSNKQTPMQEYTITGEARRVVVKKSVVCHKERYPYAVFYCHKTQDTRFYMVPMKGSDGTDVKAVVPCHTDTSKWNPKHLSFQVLKVQPGTVPICHFLPEDHILWFSK